MSAINNYVEILWREIDGLDDARRGTFHEPNVSSIMGLVPPYSRAHNGWFRVALEQMNIRGADDDDIALLLESHERHQAALIAVVARDNGDIGTSEYNEALALTIESATKLQRLTTTKRGRPRKSANTEALTVDTRMYATWKRHLPESTGWSQRQWAIKLNCSPGTIGETETWRIIMADRTNERFKRASVKTDKRRNNRAL